MRKYSKPQIVAKNLPTGSYAAGCPVRIEMGPLLITIVLSVSEPNKSLSGLYCINTN